MAIITGISATEAEKMGREAAKAGKSQNDNPYDQIKQSYLATVWNHAFCNEAFGTTVFDD